MEDELKVFKIVRSKHKANTKEYKQEYYQKNKERHRARMELWSAKNPGMYAKYNYEYNKRLRLKVLQHYSEKEVPCCRCCSEDILQFLSIDHIVGGRGKVKIGSDSRGHSFYFWLIQENFPKGFQVLCHNCNMAKGAYGECPHKEIYSKMII